MNQNETKFLKEFHAALIQRGWLSFPQNSFVAPGSRYVPGTPDILACSPDGSFFGFELKTPNGVLQKSQKTMALEFEARNLSGRYIVVRSDSDWPIMLDSLC